MKRKRRHDDGKRPDEQISAMLERHVRGKEGSATINTRIDASLRVRLAANR